MSEFKMYPGEHGDKIELVGNSFSMAGKRVAGKSCCPRKTNSDEYLSAQPGVVLLEKPRATEFFLASPEHHIYRVFASWQNLLTSAVVLAIICFTARAIAIWQFERK